MGSNTGKGGKGESGGDGVVVVDQAIFRKANGKMAVPANEVRFFWFFCMFVCMYGCVYVYVYVCVSIYRY